MNTNEIQARLDAMPAKLTDRGVAQPSPTLTLNANAAMGGMIMWFEPKNGYNYQSSHFKGETADEIVSSMEAWIAALPTRDERRMAEFTEALASVIELGHANGIDVEFVNPLTEAMKRLSENALTHRAAAE